MDLSVPAFGLEPTYNSFFSYNLSVPTFGLEPTYGSWRFARSISRLSSNGSVLIVHMRLFYLTAIIALGTPSAYAHGGGLDSNGGHFNRKTGVYHCHRSYCKARGPSNTTPQPFRAPTTSVIPSRQTRTGATATPAKILAVQNFLTLAGYDVGEPDGTVGPKTKAAIVQFNRDLGNVPSDEITDQLILQLSVVLKRQLAPSS